MYGRYCGFFTPFFHFFRIFRKSRKSALQRLCRALFSLFFKIFKISAKFSKKSEKKCSAELCRGSAEHFFHFFFKIFENFHKVLQKLCMQSQRLMLIRHDSVNNRRAWCDYKRAVMKLTKPRLPRDTNRHDTHNTPSIISKLHLSVDKKSQGTQDRSCRRIDVEMIEGCCC